MANVEEALVSQVDRLLVEHRRWGHAQSDEVPGRPDLLPFLEVRDVGFGWERRCRTLQSQRLGSRLKRRGEETPGLGEGREDYRGFLKDIEDAFVISGWDGNN